MIRNLNILLFSPYLPSKHTTACARKIYDFIFFLHQKGHTIFLLSFCNAEDKKRVEAIKPYCTQLYLEYLKDYNRYPLRAISITQTIDSLCKNRTVDILQCENSHLVRYLPKNIGIPRLLVEHEILSSSFKERSKLENRFINKFIWYGRAMKKIIEQKKWYKQFDKIVVFCEEDKIKISKMYALKNVEVIPLGINLKDYPLREARSKLYDLIFVGNFSHFPNVDAALYFYRDILPLIKHRFPDVSVALAGANPPGIIKKISCSDKNVAVTGYTEDIRKNYARSRVFIAPIRYGTGMCFKTLEALAFRIPIVTTSIGARGIEIKDNIRITDSKQEFADAVVELLNNSDMRDNLAKKARSDVEKYYNWDSLIYKYENMYYNLLK